MININDFFPTVTLAITDKIATAGSKINTIMSEVKTYLQIEVQSAADQLETKIDTKMATLASAGDATYTSGAIDTMVDAKQDTLVSGTNVKTVNGKDITGSGDVVIETSSALHGVDGFDGDVSISNTNNILGLNTHLYTGITGGQSLVTGIGSIDYTVPFNGSGYYLYSNADRTINEFRNDAGVAQDLSTPIEILLDDNKLITKNTIKGLDVAYSYHVTDGFRGDDKDLATDLSSAEDGRFGKVTPTSTGVTLGNGSTSDIRVNENLKKYVLHTEAYTNIRASLTSSGTLEVVAFNPITKCGMCYRVGSDSATDSWRPFLVDYQETKKLNGATGGYVYHGDKDNKMQLYYSTTGSNASSANDAWENTAPTDTSFHFKGNHGNVNDAGFVYVDYFFGNSDYKKLVKYEGNVTVGNEIEVGFRANSWRIKRVDLAGNWNWQDSLRETSSSLFMNTSGVSDVHQAYTVAVTDTSLILNSTDATFNSSGTNYIAIVERDTVGDGGGTYFDKPSATSYPKFNGYAHGVKGKSEGSYKNIKKFLSNYEYTTALPDISYAVIDDLGVVSVVENEPQRGGKVTGFLANGDDNPSITNTVPIMTSDTAPSGIAFANNNTPSDGAHDAFDGTSSALHSTLNNAVGFEFGYIYDTPIAINKIRWKQQTTFPQRSLGSGNIWVSNDTTVGSDGTWTLIATVSGYVSGDFESGVFTDMGFLNSTKYKAIKVEVISTAGGVTDYLTAEEVHFIEAQVLDIELADYYDKTTNKYKNYLDVSYDNGYAQIAKIYASGGKVYKVEKIEVAELFGNITVNGVTKLNGNRFKIPCGDVDKDNEYTYAYPNLGFETKASDWDVKAETFENGLWSETGWSDHSSISTSGYGTVARSNAKGIVIVTGVQGVNYGQSNGIGSGHNQSFNGSIDSAPCQIIATYIGETKDA